MQLAEWMEKNRYTIMGFEKATGLTRPTIRGAKFKYSDITLKSAMTIYRFTNGEVTFEEMLKEVKE